MFVLERPISTIKWDVSAITYEVNMVIFYYCYLSPGLKACVLYTQRRKWLREVFASQSENSPVKRLVGNMQVLHVPCDSEEDVQRHTDLLDETLSLCEDIDLAMGEHSMSHLCWPLSHMWLTKWVLSRIFKNKFYVHQKCVHSRSRVDLDSQKRSEE